MLVSPSVRADNITLADAKAAWSRSYARLERAQTEEDYAKVLATMRPLAQAGLSEAERVLGWMYEHGAGLPADPALAFDWYTKAAKAGDPAAAGILGDIYAEGRLGQAADRAQSRQWYVEGRKRGDRHSQLSIVAMRIRGEGTGLDRPLALKEVYLGADTERDPEAQDCLALLYSREGPGVPRNLVKAAMWHRLAGGDGSRGAAWPWSAKLGEDLASRLSPGEAARAEAAAAEARRIVDAGGCSTPTEAMADTKVAYDPDPRWHEIRIPLKTFMLVPVQIEGKGTFEFILDSGAPISCIDGDLARKLGLRECGLINSYGEMRPVYGVDAALYGNTLTQMLFSEQAMNNVSLYFERRIAGLIGYNLLSRFVVEIDYAGRRIRFRDPSSYAYEGKGNAVPLTFTRGFAYASGTLQTLAGAKLTLPVMVDTGGGSEIYCGAEFNREHDFAGLVPKLIRGSSVRMLDGSYDRLMGRFHSLSFGDLSIPFPVVSWLPKQEWKECNFTVGGSLLNRLDVVFDYPHSRLFMEPTEWISVSQTDYGVENGP